MRIREPASSPPKEIAQHLPAQYCETFKVTTITPVLGGGIEPGIPDKELSVRGTAIRGQLRYWWRFLVSHRRSDPVTDYQELFKLERKIWGGMGENNQGYASKINIRVSKVKSAEIKPCCQYTENGHNDQGRTRYKMDFLHDIPSYSLFSAKGKSPSERSDPPLPGETPAEVILPGMFFSLTIEARHPDVTEEHWQSVLDAVKWWANFGGLGSRTRRGAGTIEIDGMPALEENDVALFGCKLAVRGQTTKAPKAWNTAINKLYLFRQGEDLGRRSRGNGDKPGRSYWPEPDSIRLLTGKDAHGKHKPINTSGTFPRTAFGLPIIFDFNVSPNVGEPPKTELTPKNSERMASPLVLKAQALGNGQYRPIALLLPTNHLDNLELVLKSLDGEQQGLPKTLSRSGTDAWWPVEQSEQSRLANDIKPLKNRETNAIDAFMTYFME